MTAFEALPAETVSDAVRAVEDAIYATSEQNGHAVTPTEHTAPAVVRALLDLGWTPPAVTS